MRTELMLAKRYLKADGYGAVAIPKQTYMDGEILVIGWRQSGVLPGGRDNTGRVRVGLGEIVHRLNNPALP